MNATEDAKPLPRDEARRILEIHLNLGPKKPVSYLPLRTIEEIIGLTVPEYVSLIAKSGNKAIVFSPGRCCINSGAVYAYNYLYLSDVLHDDVDTLSKNGWPSDPDTFIVRIAREWVDTGHPVMPIIKKSFGD
jgi:hypothetical protein